jgi:hypothetical protein
MQLGFASRSVDDSKEFGYKEGKAGPRKQLEQTNGMIRGRFSNNWNN